MSEIRKEDDFISKLTGRAKYLREKGEIKSPELLERAAAALRERAEPVSAESYPDDSDLSFAIDLNEDSEDFQTAQWLKELRRRRAAPPAPLADDDDSEIKWRDLALQFDGHRMQVICFLKQILKELPETEFSSAREFLKAGPLPGEEVLRNRIAALAPPAPVVHDLEASTCKYCGGSGYYRVQQSYNRAPCPCRHCTELAVLSKEG